MGMKKIKINQVGFMPNSPKRFIIDEKPETMDFSVIKVDDVKEVVKYRGTLQEEITETGTGYVGHFDEVSEEGDYFIRCGKDNSRCFIIYNKAYAHLIRVMLSYFTYQRCGDDLGWAGKCHSDDGIIVETGECIDLSGGYHQSCDLRKSPCGVSIGLYGMARSAINDNTCAGKILFKDELMFACDYYLRLISPEGIMRNTLSFPFGWEKRQFFNSPAPASGQWCATRLLALASIIVPEKKDEYMSTALRSWEYLNSDRRSEGLYKHPAETPRGMDREEFFALTYKDSIFDKAYKVCCAADFYRATKDEKWLEYVKEAQELDARELSGISMYGYSVGAGMFFALSDAAELCGICMDKLKEAADFLLLKVDEDLWKRPVGRCAKNLFDIKMGDHSGAVTTLSDRVKDYEPLAEGYVYKRYDLKALALPTHYGSNVGTFLEIAANILEDEKYRKYSQYIADFFLGTNPMDASHVESIGYNQPSKAVFGQFFPSTPQIPGGVTVGFGTESVHSEYDMPCVGSFMWLFSEISKRK